MCAVEDFDAICPFRLDLRPEIESYLFYMFGLSRKITTMGAISQISNVARSAYRLLKQANHQVTQKHILRISHPTLV